MAENARVFSDDAVLQNDGTWLAVASDQVYLFRFDGEPYSPTASKFDSLCTVNSISILSNGARIAPSDYVSCDGKGNKTQVILFSNHEGALCLKNTFTEPESYSHCMHMSKGGKYFAAGGEASSHPCPGRVYFIL